MEDLPRIPGYRFPTFGDQDYKLKQKLNYSNGCRVICDSNIGIGRRPIDASSSAYASELPQEPVFDPSLTYGRPKPYISRQVIPHYVLYAQKCLNFKAFFSERVFNSVSEQYRIRHVNIIYYLEDDTMSVMEPPVDNAGFRQGKLVKRSKILGDDGNYYHWKDLNVGINLTINGITYHTIDCDPFTRKFLTSQGIDVGEKEDPPSNFYTQDHQQKLISSQGDTSTPQRARSAPNNYSLRRFLQYDGLILTFDASWNGDLYQILYFLTDDTIAVKEILESNNSGKSAMRMLLKRTKVPKNWGNMSQNFPSIYLERGYEENDEYYCPTDLKIGETISIFNRRFFLFNCDDFTRNYYKRVFNIDQPQKIESQKLTSSKTCNETLTSKNVHPQNRRIKTASTKKDVIRRLYNHQKKLRYLATMVAIHPEDKDRNFIIEYNLADGKIKISEITQRNSGHRAGTFLSSMFVPKPKIQTRPKSSPFNSSIYHSHEDTDNDDDFYSPNDFFIGAQINVFNHRFVIKGADLFVLNYIEANSDKFSPELIDNIRNYFAASNVEKLIEEDGGGVESKNEIFCFNKKNLDGEPIFPVEKIEDTQKTISNVCQNEKINNFDVNNYNNNFNDNDKSENHQIRGYENRIEIPAICNN